jgi:hypothetical protein
LFTEDPKGEVSGRPLQPSRYGFSFFTVFYWGPVSLQLCAEGAWEHTCLMFEISNTVDWEVALLLSSFLG